MSCIGLLYNILQPFMLCVIITVARTDAVLAQVSIKTSISPVLLAVVSGTI